MFLIIIIIVIKHYLGQVRNIVSKVASKMEKKQNVETLNENGKKLFRYQNSEKIEYRNFP